MTPSTPVFRLYLLRHAKASPPLSGQGDIDRALDDTGYAQAEIVAETAADRNLRPDLILCSTAARCRQTAEPFFRTMNEGLPIRYVDGLFTGPVSVYRDLIIAHGDVSSLMVIGHNPMIEELFHELVGEEAAAAILKDGYPPAGLAAIDFDQRPGGEGTIIGRTIEWLKPVA